MERLDLGAQDVDLGLELGDDDDGLGGAVLGVVAALLGCGAPLLGGVGAAGLGARLRVCSAALFCADDRARSSTSRASSRSVILRFMSAANAAVLGRTPLGQGAVGLGLRGPVAARPRAGRASARSG